MLTVALTKILRTEEGTRRLSVRFTSDAASWTGIVGPSGSGKTTLLRMVAGLERPDNGWLRLGERTLYSAEEKIWIAPHRRRCTLVFQEPCLFPHLNVRQNIAYGCDDPGLVSRLIELAELGEIGDRAVHRLSGGQKQRVALLRAVACRPSLLLLDEPFSALDLEKRMLFKEVIIRLYEHYRFAVLLVSHDQDEVRDLCDSVVDVERGTVVARQTGADAGGCDPAWPGRHPGVFYMDEHSARTSTARYNIPLSRSFHNTI